MSDNISDIPFKKLISRLTGQSFIYGFGQILEKITRFAIIPFYLKFLSPSDFGIIALARISPVVLSGLLTLCLESTITRFYYEWEKNGDSKTAVGSVWIACCAWGLSVTFLITHFGEYLFSFLFKQVPFDPYIRLELWAVGLTCINAVPLKLIRMQEKAKLYAILSYVAVTISLIFNIYFIAYKKDGALGAIEADLITSLLNTIPFIIFAIQYSSFRVSLSYIKQGLRFCLPLVPGNYVKSFFGIVDSFILEKFVPIYQVGLYSLAKNLANILREVSTAIKTAWIPFYIRIATEHQDYKKVLGRSSAFYFYFMAFASFVLALFAKEIILFLGRDIYIEAAEYVPLFVLATFIITHDMIFECGLLMAKKTGLMSIIPAVQLTIIFGGSLTLVPRLGAFGAIYSILAGNLVAIFMLSWFSIYYYPIFLEKKKLLINIAIAILIFQSATVFITGGNYFNDNLVIIGIVKFLIVSIYAFIIAALIGIKPEQMRKFVLSPKKYLNS